MPSDDGLGATQEEVRDALCDELAEMTAERNRLHAALTKIDAIRNSIIGRQGINWSMHIYPLVEALGEAGFEGEGYDVARPKAEAEVAIVAEWKRKADAGEVLAAELRTHLDTQCAGDRTCMTSALATYAKAVGADA